MTPDKARAVLTAMPDTTLTETRLTNSLELMDSEIGENQDGEARRIQLDGFFTADQLEAIAIWMRDPGSVARER